MAWLILYLMAKSSASGSYVHCIVNGFSNNIMFSIDLCHRGSNVVVDASIRYNKYGVWFQARFFIDVLKIVEVGSSGFSIFAFYYIKRKTIKKGIYLQGKSQEKVLCSYYQKLEGLH